MSGSFVELEVSHLKQVLSTSSMLVIFSEEETSRDAGLNSISEASTGMEGVGHSSKCSQEESK